MKYRQILTLPGGNLFDQSANFFAWLIHRVKQAFGKSAPGLRQGRFEFRLPTAVG
jgi:hypothetical protein